MVGRTRKFSVRKDSLDSDLSWRPGSRSIHENQHVGLVRDRRVLRKQLVGMNEFYLGWKASQFQTL